MTDIVAGVVCFNPDGGVLERNLAAVRAQVAEVLLIDNGSREAIAFEGLPVIRNSVNRGVSGALNQIVAWAIRRGASHVLLLDQDSVAGLDLVARLGSASGPGVAAVVPAIDDRGLGADTGLDLRDVDYAITSGMLLSVDAWKNVGGYDENLFIDYVDFDFSLRVRAAGYRIIREPSARLSHRIGEAQRRGKIVIYNHSAFRSFHMAHDMVYYARKHRRSPKELRVAGRGLLMTYAVLLRKVVIVAIFERDRRRRILALVRGASKGTFSAIRPWPAR